MGGTIFWSIDDRFEVGDDRIVIFTLVSSFVRAPECDYQVGDYVTCPLDGAPWCGSDAACAVAARHGQLNIAPLSTNGVALAAVDANRSVIINQLQVLELDTANDVDWAVGVLRYYANVAAPAAAVLAWLSPHPLDPAAQAGGIPLCNTTATVPFSPACALSASAAVGAIAATTAEESELVAAYWANLPFLDDVPDAIDAPARAVLRTYVPLCASAAAAAESTCTAQGRLTNRHSPLAPFPPLAPAPLAARARRPPAALDPDNGEVFAPPPGAGGLYAAPLPPFRLVVCDGDGDTMAQHVPGAPADPRAQRRAAKCFAAAPDGTTPGPPTWPASVCNITGPAAGRPCANDTGCGPAVGYGSPTAVAARACAPAVVCGEVDGGGGEGGCAAGGGALLKLDVAFPVPPPAPATTAMTRTVVYTLDRPQGDVGGGGWASWRDGAAVAVTAVVAYASDCGGGAAAGPYLARNAGGQGGGEAATEAACVGGAACEVVVDGVDGTGAGGLAITAMVYQVRM